MITPPFFTSGTPRFRLYRYPSPITCTSNGFRIEFTLYGEMYGTGKITMSACPSTGTEYCFQHSSSVFSWQGSVAPPFTPVTWYGAGTFMNSFRFAARGSLERVYFRPW